MTHANRHTPSRLPRSSESAHTAEVPQDRPTKVALIQCGYGGSAIELLDAFQPRHTDYCRFHNIDYLCVRGRIRTEMGPFAERYHLMLSLFDYYDLLVYMDCDALICNLTVDFRDVPIGAGFGGMTLHNEFWGVMMGVQYWRTDPSVKPILQQLLHVPLNDEVWFNDGVSQRLREEGQITVLPECWHSGLMSGHRFHHDTVVRAVHGTGWDSRLNILTQQLTIFNNMWATKRFDDDNLVGNWRKVGAGLA